MGEYPRRESAEVLSARERGAPIVALESTVISHGLPWPDNLAAALAVEHAVRATGAVPATIAILDGHVVLGLNESELERFARGTGIHKASPRDLPFLVSTRGFGATTVAGTIFLAARLGIRIVATGGIGGVHRGSAESGDVSTD